MYCALLPASGGAAAGAIVFLATFIPFFFFQMRLDDINAGTRVGWSFISNLAMAFGCVELINQESAGTGVQWSNLGTPVNADISFTMLHVFIILILDSIIYGLITWYFDAVLPGDYGVPRPLYFPFTVSSIILNIAEINIYLFTQGYTRPSCMSF